MIDSIQLTHTQIAKTAIRWGKVALFIAVMALCAAVFVSPALLGIAQAQDAQGVDDQIGVPQPVVPQDSGSIITPIINVVAGQSFIRLANLRDAGTVTNYVQVYGLSTQEVLAEFQLEVPAKASIQFQPELMVQNLESVTYDQPMVVYLENGYADQVWQHVQVDPISGTLKNASVCTFVPHADYVPPGSTVVNMHTSRVQGLMSVITAHNYTSVDGDFEIMLYDAASGELVGTLPVTIPARSTANYVDDQLHRLAGFFPDPDQIHLNVEVVARDQTAEARLVVQHRIYDLSTATSEDLSTYCPINGGIIQLPPVGEPQ